MPGLQRESEMARYLQIVTGTDDELVNTIRLQTLQLQVANDHCRRMETLLEKLDAATETLIRCCGVDRSELRPQVESKPDRWLGSESNLQQQLLKGQLQLLQTSVDEPQENTPDRKRYDEAVAEVQEKLENELYQRLLEKLERDEQRERMEREQAEQQQQAWADTEELGEPGAQLDAGVEEQQLGAGTEELGEPVALLATGVEERQGDQQGTSSDQPARKSCWRRAAVWLAAAPLVYYGLLPWLWSVLEANVQLVHLSPPLC